MDKIALAVAVFAIIATFVAANASSTRNEAHQQTAVIQSLLAELSSLTHKYFETRVISYPTVDNIKNEKASFYESVCNMKCDLLESTLNLLVRRCTSMLFYDANAREFKEQFVDTLGDLRNIISIRARHDDNNQSTYIIDVKLIQLYTSLNEFVGNRFRPVLEKRAS